MIKVLLASVLIIASTVGAHAGHRHGHRHGSHIGPYHYGHSYHHGHRHGQRRNYGGYIAGAVALGILGAIVYDQYGRRCYRQIIGYDYDGEPITKRICE